MNRPLLSRLTTKGQATIPAEVRRALGLRSGDRVVFEMKRGKVSIRKAARLDRHFQMLADEAFSEWSSAEDEDAFRDL